MLSTTSVLENLLTSDLLTIFHYQWVSIFLEKEAWKDIESYVLFMSLDRLITCLCLNKRIKRKKGKSEELSNQMSSPEEGKSK